MPTSAYLGCPLPTPYLQAVYKGCTRDAHRVYQLKSYELPVSIPCTPLVHGLRAGYIQGSCGIMDTAAWKGRNEGGGREGNC